MLMVNGQPTTSALGNFYFSPVRLRPVFEPTYFQKSRIKRTDSNLDLSLDVKPKLRHKGVKKHSRDDEDEDEDAENDSEAEQETTKKKENKKNKKKSQKKHKDKKNHDDSKVNATFQHLCSKLQLSFVLGALGIIILLACCCALFLRNRLVACCKRCWPWKRKKNPSNANLFDVEEGEYPYQTSKKFKKNKNPTRLINTATQDSRTTIGQDEPPTPVGCSPCCKKKKKKSSKKRRK